MGAATDYAMALSSWEEWAMEAAIRIEKTHGLYGYPPEVVSAGLQGFDRGEDPVQAAEDYMAKAREGGEGE